MLLMSISAFAQNGTITHFIYISKENRSFDSYFGSFPGVQSYCTGGHSPARTVCYAPSVAGCTTGDTCPYPVGSGTSACGGLSTGGLAINNGSAQPLLLECAGTTYHDISHTHTSLLSYVDGGAMDNFRTDGCSSDSAAQSTPCSYAYYDSSQIGPYYTYAATYGLADNFFSGMFPSQPGHMYMFAASSNGVSDNASGGGGGLITGGKTCQTGPNAGNTCSCSGLTCNDTTSCGSSTPTCSSQWASSWTCEAGKSGTTLPFAYNGHEFSLSQYSTVSGGVCLNGSNAGANCTSNSSCPGSVCTSTLTNGQPSGLYCTSNNGTAQAGPVSCSTNIDCTNPSYPQCRGTGYAGGTCSNGAACTCWSSPGNGGSPSTNCIDTADCGSSSPTCNVAITLENTPGSPCPQLVTIGDQMDVAGVSWKYYSSDPARNSVAMFSTTRYGYCTASHSKTCRQNSDCNSVGGTCVQDFASHSPIWSTGSDCTNATCGGENQFLSDAATAAGWCSNNHSIACSMDNQCSGAGSCVDNNSTALSTVSFVQPGKQNPGANEHPSDGAVATGVAYTQTVLNTVFSNPYLYNHSVVFITWDDAGGFWDHVPPPMQDGLNLGARVPLLCIGPYCRNSVNHLQMEFASVLKCIESLFGVPTINTRDANATDACFGTGTRVNPGTGANAGMLNLVQTPIPSPGPVRAPTLQPGTRHR